MIRQGSGHPVGQSGGIFKRFYRVEKLRGNSGGFSGLAVCGHVIERRYMRARLERQRERRPVGRGVVFQASGDFAERCAGVEPLPANVTPESISAMPTA